MTVITEEQMRDRLRQACKAAGGQAAFARSAGASPAYVSDVLCRFRFSHAREASGFSPRREDGPMSDIPLTCTICGSFEWMAVAPGTAPDASRFLQFNPFELRPAEPVPAVAFCLAHWTERFAVKGARDAG